MATVQLENVVKTYPGNITAVHNANLTIHDREFVVLVGPSGCGKSTTLRMIAGLEEISSGTITIDDRVINDVPPKDRDIAMVFQNYALYPHMTVAQNMAFGLKLRRYPRHEIEQRVRDAADILDIQHLLDRKPKALSGGQRQRVAVGRAIVRKPKAFLFDEPLSNLDAKMRVQMRMEINKLHTRLQSTMIYVTHDQVEAMTMGDRIVVMKDGHIQQVATPLDLYHQPANQFVAGFIGSPPMNFFRGQLETQNGTRCFRTSHFALPLPADLDLPHPETDVILGLRPEDIQHTPQAETAASFTARVDVVEPMGAEIFIYCSAGTDPFIARLNAGDPVRVGDTLQLTATMSQARLFNVTNGDRLDTLGTTRESLPPAEHTP